MVRSVDDRSGPLPRDGLRARKKLAVRRALGSAAVRLAMERGLENVTIEDITAEADVSVRTFGNYFSSKYEAICAPGTDRARRIGAELLARQAREPLWQALVGAVLAHYEGADQAPDAEWLARLKLVLRSPAIRGEYLKVSSGMQEALAEAIAVRTGTEAGQDMYPRILAGAVTAAAEVAVRAWAAADPPVPLRPLLHRALDQLATACSGRGGPGEAGSVTAGSGEAGSGEAGSATAGSGEAGSGGAGRYLTEEEFKALVRPAILGPNGPLCEPPVR
jgi:AcrR family transcriptional regulator